ncbi:DNA circularization protein [Edwardsiella anguillarum]|uniref:DNA circularization protein n=1 Tax=Edwardsiella anguillarum TaxID=1821960 RepID=UPI0024B864B9|nr:DNA circularization N-terminal domain-containing protein [Edwardsiella anguillarum]WHP88992.1 DNA circularization N-terminal domain-containing protein [Edwardsiella anguillarum]WHP92793.1 DNA circularization N-terminal domain-containing protein [Edwardsiella anguillarum]WHP96597.1 DNA circularization N-terminal domain-containing protein [Edwardsiella anguillarum]WHQ00467.1 DNA circularization N-terminal domain-containing protein [Edwardsiella anguillarum]WHQ04215.1 DNA circularization N-ter
MPIIMDAITSLMGGGASDNWQSQLRASSFRGVPFAIVMEEGSHGRRQAVHEYPYRNSAWIEDLGRGVRRFVLRGFIIQNSQIYGGGDVITQRQSLISACETKGSGTLVHPTLGELTVSIPENGLRISGSQENGRVFEFTLIAIESGLKVFAITDSTTAGDTVNTNYLKLVSTTITSTLARIKGEIRGVTQAINTIKGTVAFWTSMVDSTISEVTNLSNVLNSTFGNTRYGRYNKGAVGGSASAVSGNASTRDVGDDHALANRVTAQSVMDRKNITDTVERLNNASTPDDFVRGIADVVNAIISSAGSMNDRISALEKLANAISTEYQQSDSSKAISSTINTMIVVLCSGAMTRAAADASPTSRDEAEAITQRVSVQLDTALILAGDRAEDGMYGGLLAVRSSFLATMSDRASGLSELIQVTMAQPLPALTLANRLYQDATRADELVQEARVPHPAFMPTTMKVLRQ